AEPGPATAPAATAGPIGAVGMNGAPAAAGHSGSQFTAPGRDWPWASAMKSGAAAPSFRNHVNGVAMVAPVDDDPCAGFTAAPDIADDEVPDPVSPLSRLDNDVEPVAVWLAASVSR